MLMERVAPALNKRAYDAGCRWLERDTYWSSIERRRLGLVNLMFLTKPYSITMFASAYRNKWQNKEQPTCK